MNFSTEEPFENGLTRVVEVAGDLYYVLDFWIPMGWENGVWIRGILEVPRSSAALTNLLRAAMITLPIFILLAAVGGYLIARRAFRPLEQITSTAAAISEASDLSARVEIPPGKNEFVRLAQTFNQMFERLERSFEAETQFTADASHELRTPTTVIISQCEYAIENAQTLDEAKEALAAVLNQAEKMAALISQLLMLARADKGHEKLHFETVNLSDLASMVAEQQQENAERRGIRIKTNIQPDIEMLGDETMLMRMWINLIENGIKYGRENGWLNVQLAQKDGTIQGCVQDNGIGIAPENLARVWERFWQADPARSASGAGL